MEVIWTFMGMVGTLSGLIICCQFAMGWYARNKTVWFPEGVKKGLVENILDLLLLGDLEGGQGDWKAENNDRAPTENGQTDEMKVPWWDRRYGSLVLCTIGLQTTFLTWGLMQEKLMTQEYDGERFTSSRFLVLVNRLLAVIFAYGMMQFVPQPKHRAPALEYSYASATNVLSSFCQYEALQFVSFPMQTVAKACKVIPTMIMGTMVQKKTYSVHEYISAVVISIGVALFSLLRSGKSLQDFWTASTTSSESLYSAETLSGLFLLAAYLTCDSFTSNWQGRLFSTYKVSSLQCMLGINGFSSLISLLTLIQSNELVPSFVFLAKHPLCATHVMIMSLCSAIGQLFIFRTISKHGPVVFTIISVTRQLMSIVLSSIMFGHAIAFQAWGAVMVTFSGILYSTWAKSSLNSSAPKLKRKKE